MTGKSKNETRKGKSKDVKRVALLLESDMSFDRAIARGVGDYIQSHTGWVILMDPVMKVTMEGIRHWNPDAIITSIHLPAIREIVNLQNIPMVGFGSYSEEHDGCLKIPVVTSNQEEIGREAARHFINNGLRNFAFCGGDETAPWCRQRQAGFEEELAKHGYHANIFNPGFKGTASMPEALRALSKWLKELTKPTGVLVFFDGWARWFLIACTLENLQVPQQISVLGVDNDRWLCELSQPRLSSVDPNVTTAGYAAAQILDRMLQGESNVPRLTHIDPAGVVPRESSNYMAFSDREVAFAMRYIREHACDPITPTDVLKVTGMSNSTAYRKFMKAIGRSIHSEIQRTQMDRVKQLLTTTNLNVTSIARQSGFDNIRYLTKVFGDFTGMTPTEFRRVNSTPSISNDH